MKDDPRTHDFKPLPDIEFRPWPKIGRLNRTMTITEKIDGTNAAVGITEDGRIYAQSRNRIITPEADNAGFARWVNDNADALREALGKGLHFGEWFGPGIQKFAGALTTKHFALFNVDRYEPVPFAELGLPNVVTVPRIYTGPFGEAPIHAALEALREHGSHFGGKAEGIVVFMHGSGSMHKVTLENDQQPKGLTALDAVLA